MKSLGVVFRRCHKMMGNRANTPLTPRRGMTERGARKFFELLEKRRVSFRSLI
jgi:hypothetical protein